MKIGFSRNIKYILVALAVCAVVVMVCLSGVNRHDTDYDRIFRDQSGRDMKTVFDEGNRLLSEDKPEEAMAHYNIVYSRFFPEMTNEDRKLCARAFNNAGYIAFFKYSDYNLALEDYLSSLEIAEQDNITDLLPIIYTNIANVYYIFKDYDTAYGYYRKGFAASVTDRNEELAFKSFNNLVVMSNTGELEVDLHTQADSLRQMKVKDLSTRTFCLNFYQASERMQAGDYLPALGYIDKAIGSLPSDNASKGRHLIAAKSLKASILSRKGDHPGAIRELHELNRHFNLQGDMDVRVGALAMMSEYNYLAGNNDSSLYYAREYMHMSDSVFGVHNYGDIKDIISNRKLKSAGERYRILEVKNRFTQIFALILGVGVLIVLLMFLYTKRQKKQIEARNLDLFKRYEEVEELYAKERQLRRELLESRATVSNEFAPAQSILKSMTEEESTDNSSASALSPAVIELSEKICDIFENTEEVYREGFCLENLVQLAGASRTAVSTALNKGLGKNFTTLLGEYRIRKACSMLVGKEMESYTLEAVALGCGFKSRTNFVSIFKKNVGMTPSEYRRAAKANAG